MILLTIGKLFYTLENNENKNATFVLKLDSYTSQMSEFLKEIKTEGCKYRFLFRNTSIIPSWNEGSIEGFRFLESSDIKKRMELKISIPFDGYAPLIMMSKSLAEQDVLLSLHSKSEISKFFMIPVSIDFLSFPANILM